MIIIEMDKSTNEAIREIVVELLDKIITSLNPKWGNLLSKQTLRQLNLFWENIDML